MSPRIRFRFVTLSIAVCLMLTAHLRAENADPLDAKLGLTPATKSLPLWAKPPAEVDQQLALTARNVIAPACMLVGNPKFAIGDEIWSTSGSAFVISKKNRLIATNAHVADSYRQTGGKLFAVRNGTSVVYTIDRAPWYHPGLKRQGHDGLVRQDSDPAAGGVCTWSADVAVLHIAPGPELPAEVTFASADELDCACLTVGMMGYPGYAIKGSPDKFEWPNTDAGEIAVATFRCGVVNRLTDFHNRAGVPPQDLQYLHHSLDSWHGFSGSPIFLPNGHVVGLNNSGAQSQDGGRAVALSYGVRINVLWELLVYHKLDSLVSIPVDNSTLRLEKHTRPDPDDLALNRKVEQLVREAGELIREKKFPAAQQKCNQAIELAPEYAPAYDERSRLFQNYAAYIRESGADDQTKLLHAVAKNAFEDAKTAVQLAPTDPGGYLSQVLALLDETMLTTGSYKEVDIEEELTRLIKEDNGADPAFRSELFRFRGQARGYEPAAAADMDEAVRLAPYQWLAYQHRAKFWRANGDARADADERRASELRSLELDAYRAWDFATDPDQNKRNGAEAVRIAKQVCDATSYGCWQYVGTLAAAYAEAGDFDKAIELETKVAGMRRARAKLSMVQERLDRYRSRRPFHYD